MKDLKVSKTKKTPEIILKDSGDLSIVGVSIPEDPIPLFDPVVKWLDEYVKSPADLTTLTVQFQYINTSTKNYLVKIFNRLEQLYVSDNEVLIKWVYEHDDVDMVETGDDIQSKLKVPIEMICVE
jgi:hypothetical protein